MEMNTSDPVAVAVPPSRASVVRSRMIALALGAMLALAGAASVFAASPSADPSASPGTTSTDEAGGDSTEGTDGRVCDESHDGATDSDDASS
ncbi:MAG TPA: hypothetical protein VI277_09750 [Candidatus Limnocylindria bacterium]